MGLQKLYYLLVVLFAFAVKNFVICTNPSNQGASKNVEVQTDLGRIRGTTLTTRLGKQFLAFRGIRYAKPPVDDLRFQPPQPAEPWTGVFDATDDGPMCPQPPANNTDMSEDCLRLNVYTSDLPSHSSSKEGKPVVMYLHPGGFYIFSGQSKNNAGPELWMDRDIVLVTINYRLGTLGYLATGTKEAPGNNGFKDQVVAIKWVKQHIAKFGGNPNSITLAGCSAGALSITLHMVSPMSRNLFHRAIVMSAAGVAQWDIPTHQKDLATKQARLLNCPENNVQQMMQCFKTKSTVDFVSTLSGLFEVGGLPVLLYKPVVEPDFGQERFLVEDPTKSYLEGNFMKIPVIAGITKDDFASPAVDVLLNETFSREMDRDFYRVAPIYFQYERDTPRSRYITSELRRIFLKDEPLSLNRSLQGLSDLFAAGIIQYGIHRFVHLAAKHTTVYYYRFSFPGRYSWFYYPEKTPFGVGHQDDLLYILRIPSIAPLFTKNDPEDKAVERQTRMWSEFARCGNPNKPNDEYLRDLRWRPFNSRQENYLDIGEELVMKQGLYSDRFAVWDRLFPLNN